MPTYAAWKKLNRQFESYDLMEVNGQKLFAEIYCFNRPDSKWNWVSFPTNTTAVALWGKADSLQEAKRHIVEHAKVYNLYIIDDNFKLLL